MLSTISIGTLRPAAPTVERGGEITSSNTADDYTFHITGMAQVRVAIFGASRNLDVQLIGPDSVVISTGESEGYGIDGLVSATVGAARSTTGPYRVRVTQGNSFAISTYTVSVSIASNSDDVITNATDLGALDSSESTTVLRSGAVGTTADPVDYYRFKAVQYDSHLLALLSGSGDKSIDLLNAQGVVLNTGSESISTIIQGAMYHRGSYYLRVRSATATATLNYNLAAGVDLGTIDIFETPKVAMEGSVSTSSDPTDVASFHVAQTNSIEFLQEISGRATTVAFEVRNEEGQVVHSVSARRSMVTLTPGRYSIHIFANSLQSKYSLSVAVQKGGGTWVDAGEIDPVVKPTMKYQPSLKQITGTSWRGVVARTASSALGVNLLALTGLPDGAKLSVLIFDDAGTLISSGRSDTSGLVQCMSPVYSQGSISVLVSSTVPLRQGFELSMSTDVSSDDLITNGQLFSGAMSLTAPSKRMNGTTGNATDMMDTYKLVLQQPGSLRVVLSGMTSNLDLEVINSSGQRIGSSRRTETAIDQVMIPEVLADTYYVRVATPFFLIDSAPASPGTYRLDATLETTSNDTLIAASNGGDILDTRPTYTFVAQASSSFNLQDYHRITLEESSDLRVKLSGLTQDADVELLDQYGVVLRDGQATGTASEDFTQTALEATTYYVRVFHKTPNSSLSTGYELTVTKDIRPDAPEGQDKTIVINEDTTYSFLSGDFVFSDPDFVDNSLLNVKITTLPTAGKLSLTTSAGTTQVTAGQLIPATAIKARALKYSPPLNSHGESMASFTFQVQDDGGTENGGSDLDPTPDSITFNVTSVNDAPELTSLSVVMPNILEDSISHNGILVSSITAVITDVDTRAAKGIAIVEASFARGTWEYALDGITWQSLVGVSSGAARLLASTKASRVRFLPNADATGTSALKFHAWDQAAGAVGGIAAITDLSGSRSVSSAAATLSVTVTPVNDAPKVAAVAPSLPIIDEDQVFRPGPTSGVPISALLGGVTDVDSNAKRGIAVFEVSTAGGRWQYSMTNGENWINFSTVSLSAARLLRDFAHVRVRFLPNANANIRGELKFYAWDQTQGGNGSTFDLSGIDATDGTTAFSGLFETVSQEIRSINDAPTITAPSTQPVVIDAPVVFSTTRENRLAVDDVDANKKAMRLTITANNGTFSLSRTSGLQFVSGGNGLSSFSAIGWLGAINLALNGATFTPKARAFGDADLTISVDDQGNGGDGGALTAVARIVLPVSLPTATVDLGTLNAAIPTVRRSGSRDGSTTTPDYHTFTIGATSDVRANLSGLSADVDMLISNPSGRIVGSGSLSSNTTENVLMTGLPAGTYLLTVFRQVVSAYDLTISTATIADDLISQAVTLSSPTSTTLPTIRQATTSSAADLQDYYNFSLTAATALRINLSGLSQDVDLELLDSSGRVIQTAAARDNTIENMLTPSLATGTYYVRVFASGGLLTTNYDLTISTNTTGDDVLTNATSLGILGLKGSERRTGSVAMDTDLQDYYAFSGSGDVAISVSGLSSDADVQLLDRFGRVLASSTNSSNSTESININISDGSGTIFIRIYAFSGSTNYVVEARNTSNAANADDLLSTAAVLPIPISSLTLAGRVGGTGSSRDPQDYYRLEMTSIRNVTLTLTGMSADLDIEVLDQFGQRMFFSQNSGTANESITMANLGIGFYYIRIYPFQSAISNYTLGITV